MKSDLLGVLDLLGLSPFYVSTVYYFPTVLKKNFEMYRFMDLQLRRHLCWGSNPGKSLHTLGKFSTTEW